MTQKWPKMGEFGVFPSFIFKKNGKFMKTVQFDGYNSTRVFAKTGSKK